jgi:hypothetical protein
MDLLLKLFKVPNLLVLAPTPYLKGGVRVAPEVQLKTKFSITVGSLTNAFPHQSPREHVRNQARLCSCAKVQCQQPG